MGQLCLLSMEEDYDFLLVIISVSLGFRVGFRLAKDKLHLFPSHSCCHGQSRQLSLAALAGGWANAPPLELMPLRQAVAAASDLHGNSSDLAAWKQVTIALTSEDLRQVH